jgi:hypothetical protein
MLSLVIITNSFLLLANEYLGAKAQLSSVAIKNALFHYHFGGCHSLGQGTNDLD